MHDITSDTSLGTIVERHPDLARELERRSLDYCCHGRRSLAEACGEAGLDVDAVVAELNGVATQPPAPWASMGAAELADHIVATHHAYLHDELPRLSALADKVAGVHGGRHPELEEVRTALAELRADLEPHMMKEERVLFPMISELAAADGPVAFHCGSVQNPISMMLIEHDRQGELLTRLNDLTDGYTAPADGCASYLALYAGLAELEADTHAHVHKENHRLFPMVVEMESALPTP